MKILDFALHVAPVIVEAGTDVVFGEEPKIEVLKGMSKELQGQAKEIIERNDLIRKLAMLRNIISKVERPTLRIPFGRKREGRIPRRSIFRCWDWAVARKGGLKAKL